MKFLIKAIGPKRGKIIDPDYFRKEVLSVMGGEVKNDIIADFRKTVTGWKNPPAFGSKVATTNRNVTVFVFPTGDPKAVKKYGYIVHGTRARKIYPRNKKALSFQTGYTPSTRPGRITSRSYARYGKKIARAFVRHPGIKPRDFDKLIAKGYKPEFKKDIENAIRRAARRGNS